MHERVLLRRCGDARDGHDDVEAVELPEDGGAVAATRLPADRLAAFVAERERASPRWVWDDSTRWYPDLLRAGVRVGRCWDLRLSHDLLRRSPCVPGDALDGEDAAAWDRLQPTTPSEPALFADPDPAAGLDVLAEHERQRAAVAASTDPARLGLLLAAESSGALVAAELTHAGLPWRAEVHARLLDGLFGARPAPGGRPAGLERLVREVRAALDAPGLNPDSAAALLQALRAAGLAVDDTRSWTLQQLDHPVVPPLLEYKKLARLLSTNGWHWLDTWVHDDRFHPDYLPGGVVTGRWSSRGGGALTVPGPLRPAVVADDGWRLVVADAAQLEPRVLAGLSGDEAMAEAARATDLYAAMAASGAVATRAEAKLGILGAMYGGTRGESGRMVERLSRRYPSAFGYVEAAARAGERGEVVRTLLGRGSPPPPGDRAEATSAAADGAAGGAMGGTVGGSDRERRAWGRFTRNFVVQGTAAEWALCWLALLRNRLWQLGGPGEPARRPHLVLFLHDEVLVHAPVDLAEQVEQAVRAAAADAGRLLFGTFPVDFPLDVSVVASWADAR